MSVRCTAHCFQIKLSKSLSNCMKVNVFFYLSLRFFKRCDESFKVTKIEKGMLRSFSHKKRMVGTKMKLEEVDLDVRIRTKLVTYSRRSL